jgi:hypothetical protein
VQREVATMLPDRPHAFAVAVAGVGPCEVCGAERAADLHQAYSAGLQHPRERASGASPWSVREFG